MYYQPFVRENYAPTLGDLERAGYQIFDDSWNTYVPEHKKTLETAIMRAYRFNQIGAETPDRFIYNINAHLAEIMPYYNQLYASELIKFNPLVNHSLETNGRNIENLISKTNGTDDKFAKAVRDFVGLSDKSASTAGTSNTAATSNKDFKEDTTYQKSGIEDGLSHTAASGTEDEKTTGDKSSTEKQTASINENTNTNMTTTTDKTVTENPGQVSTRKTDYGQTETGEENFTGKVNAKGTGSKEWTEVTDDDSTTKTVTDLDETGELHRREDYADTPQKQLSVGSDGSGIPSIRQDYLTNVRWTDENTTHNADTTQDVTFADDMTKTHNETTTDNTDTDTNNTTNTSKSKGGSDTETTTMSGQNITDTHQTETQRGDVKKTGNNVTDTVGSINDTVTRDLDTTDDSTTTTEKSWSESGSSNTTGTENTKQNTDTTSKTDSSETQQNHERSDLSQSQSAMSEKNVQETTDTGSSTIAKGFMNVSPSALLEAFRKTFLNVDQQIVQALREEFMWVY